jgi:formate hydrogenlyase subunit 3/multisubunit Na+/H+ antiporter MnhD subunit
MLAYSSVAQVGYLFLAYALFQTAFSDIAWNGVVLMALSHGFAKSAAFLAVGALALKVGSDAVEDWGGLAEREPVLVLSLALAGVSLIGLPPSGGFLAKFLLLTASIRQGQVWVAVILIVGGLLASIFVIKMIGAAMQTNESHEDDTELSIHPLMRWVPMGLAFMGIALTFFSVRIIDILTVGYPF